MTKINPCSVCGLSQYIRINLSANFKSYLECRNCDNTSEITEENEDSDSAKLAAIKVWNQENCIA